MLATTLRDQRAALARGRRLARISAWVLSAGFAFLLLGSTGIFLALQTEPAGASGVDRHAPP